MKRSVLVFGMGLSGRSAVKLLQSRGFSVIGADRSADVLQKDERLADLLPHGLTLISDAEPVDFSKIDWVVLSPGVPPTHPLVLEAQKKGIEVIGEIELASRFITQKCIGITGTNGKTTVTLLVEHVLRCSGFKAQALGNVEIPLGEALVTMDLTDHILVIELSSFQLETLQTPILDTAVILNITPDHLDRYPSMEAYAKAKLAIGNVLKPGAPLYLEEQILKEYKPLIPHVPIKTYGYDPSCDFVIDQKKRSHDSENETAAFALCGSIGVTPSQFKLALTSFKKPSHRIEFVRKVDDIAFYDDSKGTNVDAVIRAVQTLHGDIVLIAGGVDKGSPYTPWIKAFEGKVKGICAIGQSASKIEHDLSHQIPVKQCQTLQEAVEKAAKWAKAGENVLLSPGCSSYDMFRDYKHRGEEFQHFVQQL